MAPPAEEALMNLVLLLIIVLAGGCSAHLAV
jgi:hypothetical protein